MDDPNIRGFHRGNNKFDVYVNPQAYESLSLENLLEGKVYPKYGDEPERALCIQRSGLGKTLLWLSTEQKPEKIVLRLSDIEYMKLGMINQGTYFNKEITLNISLE